MTGAKARIVLFLTLCLTLLQALSVFAQGVSGTPDVSLAFSEAEFPVAREGYVQLKWNTVEPAVAYEVTEARDGRAYYGEFPQAFVSGLSDGTYLFTVTAFGTDGEPLAVSDKPAEVVVRHWPLSQAVALFAIGLCVFLTLIGVIIYGTRMTRMDPPNTSHASVELS